MFTPAQARELRKTLASVSNGSMHVDRIRHRFWHFAELIDPSRANNGRAFVAGMFLENGNLILLYCNSDRDDFDTNFPVFVMLNQSIHDLSRQGNLGATGAIRKKTDAADSIQAESPEAFLAKARAKAVESLRGQIPDSMLIDPKSVH